MSQTPQEALNQWRMQIDQLDTELLTLLAKRRQIVLQIGQYKQNQGLEPFDPTRWEQVLHSNRTKAHILGLSAEFIERLYDLIHEYSLDIQSPPKEPNA